MEKCRRMKRLQFMSKNEIYSWLWKSSKTRQQYCRLESFAMKTDITQCQTVRADWGIIPYSTEIHWRLQNYTNEFGCYARETHRWLLEYRWIKRFVWFLDRFHPVYCIGRETSKRIKVVRSETDKMASDIQARSFMARALDKIGKKC